MKELQSHDQLRRRRTQFLSFSHPCQYLLEKDSQISGGKEQMYDLKGLFQPEGLYDFIL